MTAAFDPIDAIDAIDADYQRYWDTVQALHQPTLAQIAYDAYVADAGGVSLATGAPLPEWVDLSPAIQRAWAAVAAAVIGRMFGALRPAMVHCAQALAENNQELREACTIPSTGLWDAELPTELATYQSRQSAAMALLDAVALLDAATGSPAPVAGNAYGGRSLVPIDPDMEGAAP